jgi:hypothetical protein
MTLWCQPYRKRDEILLGFPLRFPLYTIVECCRHRGIDP